MLLSVLLPALCQSVLVCYRYARAPIGSAIYSYADHYYSRPVSQSFYFKHRHKAAKITLDTLATHQDLACSVAICPQPAHERSQLSHSLAKQHKACKHGATHHELPFGEDYRSKNVHGIPCILASLEPPCRSKHGGLSQAAREAHREQAKAAHKAEHGHAIKNGTPSQTDRWIGQTRAPPMGVTQQQMPSVMGCELWG